MPQLSNEERINEINRLFTEISPLNYERISLDTTLNFLNENFLKTYDDSLKQEIIKTKARLQAINSQLAPMFTQLRSLQILYRIQYEGEYTDIAGRKNWDTLTENLYFQTDCNIDTTKNSDCYQHDTIETINKLFVELQMFLYNHRFTNFKIKHIKRL